MFPLLVALSINTLLWQVGYVVELITNTAGPLARYPGNAETDVCFEDTEHSSDDCKLYRVLELENVARLLCRPDLLLPGIKVVVEAW